MINQFNILDFGAVAGAENAQTAAIQAAIDAADAAKGTVVIPAGTFKTGSLNLKGADLYLEKGAVLLGSERREDYTFNGYVHCEFGETFSLLYSLNHQDITISGEGTIDLNGKSFFDFSTYNLPEELADRFNDEQKEESTALFTWRPNQPIFFYGCTHVTVRDITILDAPSWTLTFAECDRVLVDGITNIGHPRVPNNDGIHITASRNVIISNCNITSADDCIAISSITNWSKPCENVTVTNCILRSFSKAIVLGYVHSIVRNVTISNCLILDSNRAFCIMPAPETGLVENVTVSNLRLDTRVRAGNWWGNGEPILVFSLPHKTTEFVDYSDDYNQRHYKVNVRNVYFQNIVCTSENAAGVIGQGDNIRNVVFDHVYVTLKDSDNRAIKGDIFDVAPSKVPVAVPQSDPECVFYVHGAQVELSHVAGEDAQGNPGAVIVE